MKRFYVGVLSLVMIVGMMIGGCGVEKKESNSVTNITNNEYAMGWIPDSSEKYASFNKASMSKVGNMGANPEAVDLSAKFPTPGSQGMQSSCTAWATAYALKTYLEKVDYDWDQDTIEHQFSPAYVYNQINGGRDQGSSISDALDLIVKQGVCTLATMPYNVQNYTVQPNNEQRAEAAKYKSLSWGTISKGNIEEFKTQLAAGIPIVVGIPVYNDFDRISANDPIYDNADGNIKGYHAICLVGYDDNKKAFKFINSWGNRWGLNGYGYIAYNLIQQFQTPGYVMQDINDNDDPRPTIEPIPDPTIEPIPNPTNEPDPSPSMRPRPFPTIQPFPFPTIEPVPFPTIEPNPDPTIEPFPFPSTRPWVTLRPIVTPTFVPNVKKKNVALDKAGRASSHIAKYVAKNAFDGNPNTCWVSRSVKGRQWIAVDLSKTCTISSLHINWSPNDYPQKYTIYIWNGSQWISAKTVHGNGKSENIQLDSPICGEFILINCSKPNSNNYVMYECKVYGY